MNLEPTWTEARVDALKSAYKRGLSASKIAHELGGVTRNAVIGKLHRLGIIGTKPAYVPKPKVERRAPLRRAELRIHTGGGRAFRGEVELVFDNPGITDLPPATSMFACTITELTDNTCRWPLGTPSADMQYCGAPPYPGYVYCEGHARLAYTPAGRRG